VGALFAPGWSLKQRTASRVFELQLEGGKLKKDKAWHGVAWRGSVSLHCKYSGLIK
jgi:hypothetical protein